ncbi:hypothetical protein AURDEDRAFT_174411 [Auricularia subglabra TFB-10046 SS5]|uniref:Uncharacterized protein n=1 Tax=Auricularia subglabra (strain TFB-10046 / SS5) TaxID=717982 RepID=J0WTB8_AURST|nr:hypothetical protein AURDEDRAFT_174411 [Auricularia subglabra TFB-10046 SS5]
MLVDVTISCTELSEFAASRIAECKVVDAPVLKSIALRWSSGDDHTGARSIFPLIRAFSAPRLERIIIQTSGSMFFLDADLSMFSAVAERLIVHDIWTSEDVEIALRDSLGGD